MRRRAHEKIIHSALVRGQWIDPHNTLVARAEVARGVASRRNDEVDRERSSVAPRKVVRVEVVDRVEVDGAGRWRRSSRGPQTCQRERRCPPNRHNKSQRQSVRFCHLHPHRPAALHLGTIARHRDKQNAGVLRLHRGELAELGVLASTAAASTGVTAQRCRGRTELPRSRSWFSLWRHDRGSCQ